MRIDRVLNRMIALLSPPGSWCQRAMARNAAGIACHPTSSEAASWCIYGAMFVATGDDDALVDTLDEFLFNTWGATGSAVNDDPNTTHQTILARLRHALDVCNLGVQTGSLAA